MEVVTHISHAKDVCNTVGAVPNLSRVARQLTNQICVGPSSIAMNAHGAVGLAYILEERTVQEDIDCRACVKDDPGGGEVTIILGELVRIISDMILYTLHQKLCGHDICSCSVFFCTIMGDVTYFTAVVLVAPSDLINLLVCPLSFVADDPIANSFPNSLFT